MWRSEMEKKNIILINRFLSDILIKFCMISDPHEFKFEFHGLRINMYSWYGDNGHAERGVQWIHDEHRKKNDVKELCRWELFKIEIESG